MDRRLHLDQRKVAQRRRHKLGTRLSKGEKRHRKRGHGGRRYTVAPYVRTPETRAFQRWVVGAYDKTIPWSRWWGEAGGEPRKLGPVRSSQLSILEVPKV